MTADKKGLPIFCGILPGGNSAAILQVILGKVEFLGGNEAKESEELLIHGLDGVIQLTDVVLIHRVFATQLNKETGKPELLQTHNAVDDPYFARSRGSSMPFALRHFLSGRILNPEDPLELTEINRYEGTLQNRWASMAGIVSPPNRGIIQVK